MPDNCAARRGYTPGLISAPPRPRQLPPAAPQYPENKENVLQRVSEISRSTFGERERPAGPDWKTCEVDGWSSPYQTSDGGGHSPGLGVVPARLGEGWMASRSRCETRDTGAPHMATEEVSVEAWRRTADNSGGPQSGDSEHRQRARQGGRRSLEAAEMCGDRRSCGVEEGIALGREPGARRRRGRCTMRLVENKVGQFPFSMIWGTWVFWVDVTDNVPLD
jgi:hypothetical protein